MGSPATAGLAPGKLRVMISNAVCYRCSYLLLQLLILRQSLKSRGTSDLYSSSMEVTLQDVKSAQPQQH